MYPESSSICFCTPHGVSPCGAAQFQRVIPVDLDALPNTPGFDIPQVYFPVRSQFSAVICWHNCSRWALTDSLT